jgi:hypothetical protein
MSERARISALLRHRGEPISYASIVASIGQSGRNAMNGPIASALMEMVQDGTVVTIDGSPRRFFLREGDEGIAMTECNHVRYSGGVAMETFDNAEAVKEVQRLGALGHIAAIVYGSDAEKMRRKAQRDFGKNWLKPVES